MAVPACYTPMANQSFEQHFRVISSTFGSSTQLEMSRQLVRTYCVATHQVADLMGLLYTDAQRLELARSAFPSVVDPEQFITLADLMFSSSSRQELYSLMQRSAGPVIESHQMPVPVPTYPYQAPHPRWDDDHDDHYDQDYDDRPYQHTPRYQPRTRNINTLGQVIAHMRREPRQHRQLLLAQNYVSRHSVNTAQVVRLMRELRYDQSRLTLAQYSFHFVTDRHQYRQVIGALDQPRHKAEMRAWLQR